MQALVRLIHSLSLVGGNTPDKTLEVLAGGTSAVSKDTVINEIIGFIHGSI